MHMRVYVFIADSTIQIRENTMTKLTVIYLWCQQLHISYLCFLCHIYSYFDSSTSVNIVTIIVAKQMYGWFNELMLIFFVTR